MNSTALSAALGVLVIIASAAFFFFGKRLGHAAERQAQALAKGTAEQTATRIVGEAEREAESLRKSAVISGKEELIKLRENWEVEARRRREEVEREEKRVQDREAVLDRKFDVLEGREKDVGRRGSELGRKEKTIAEREQELERLMGEERRRLEVLAGISAEQAKAELIHRLEAEAEADAANRLREIRESAKRNAEREARNQAIAAWKILRARLPSERHFGDRRSAGQQCVEPKLIRR